MRKCCTRTLQQRVEDLERQLKAARRELALRDQMIRTYSRGISMMCGR